MAAFTLYGARFSTNTDRLRLTLAEAGFTDYKLEILDMSKGEHKSPDNLKRHPWGKIPSIVFADGFTLYESRAIAKYLTRKYQWPLLPAPDDIRAQALFDQAESEETYFSESASKIAFETIAKRFVLKLPPDEAILRTAVAGTEKFFDVAEGLLQQKDYMAGANFSLIDIFYVPLIVRLFISGNGNIITSRPAVHTWWKRVTERPAIRDLLEADKQAAANLAAAVADKR